MGFNGVDADTLDAKNSTFECLALKGIFVLHKEIQGIILLDHFKTLLQNLAHRGTTHNTGMPFSLTVVQT